MCDDNDVNEVGMLFVLICPADENNGFYARFEVENQNANCSN